MNKKDSSIPGQAVQKELDLARRYRGSRRASLVPSWSAAAIQNSYSSDNNSDDNGSSSPPSQPPQPRRAKTGVFAIINTPSSNDGSPASIATPPPAAHPSPFTHGTQLQHQPKYSTDTSASTSTVIGNDQTCPPSIPPPPPRITVSHTETTGFDGDKNFNDQRAAPKTSPSPVPSVREVAIRDAQANMDKKMFSNKVLNFRDLSVSVIKAGLQHHLDRERAEHEGPMPGVVFRSAELGSANEHDIKMLFSKYGIRTIIDLRSELEARASEIITKHYPSSIQPTADQSMERLMKLRASQLKKTVVEVAAHDYEVAAKPWEKTGETRSSWSQRNSLRYSKSIGDPRKDPLARELAHLYDDVNKIDSAKMGETPGTLNTQHLHLTDPYVPQCRLSAEEAPGTISPTRPLSPGLAQSAYDWGSETLQMLRSYWDQPWKDFGNRENSTLAGNDGKRLPSLASVSVNEQDDGSHSDSDSVTGVFYRNSINDVNRVNAPYGLAPVDRQGRNSAPEAISHQRQGSNAGQQSIQSYPLLGHQRAITEPLICSRQGSTESEDNHGNNDDDESTKYAGMKPSSRFLLERAAAYRGGQNSPSVQNRFRGKRRRYRCNVIGDNYRKRCVWANTPWSTRIKVIWRFATFNKTEAIRTIGREVLSPRGLAGSYEDYLDYCKEEFAAVMRIFADPCAYPILFHCQHGKDRTGIVAMLLLGILEVDHNIIAEDYARSQESLLPVRERMELIDMGALGLSPSFCDSPKWAMLSLLKHIKKNYGSVRGYLRSAGLQEQEIKTIAWCLRGNFCGLVNAQSQQAQSAAQRFYLRPGAARSDIFRNPQQSGTMTPHQPQTAAEQQ